MEAGLKKYNCDIIKTKVNKKKIQFKRYEIFSKYLDNKNFNSILFAYEPVWAIGSNKTPSPEEIEKVHSFIKNHISERFGEHATNHCRIIYGGSVNKNNALKIFSLIKT